MESAAVAIMANCPSDIVVVDVGCSGGLLWKWRALADRLRVFGFDPGIDAIERLRRDESSPKHTWECGFVRGVDDGRQGPFGRNPWQRLAVVRSQEIAARKVVQPIPDADKMRVNAWQQSALAQQEFRLPAYFQEHDVSPDFIKLDVDGDDFRILQDIAPDLSARRVLGLMIEVNFFGSDDARDHTLHNVDRLMKARQFELFDLSTRRYASAALPAPYKMSYPAQGEMGRILQGDALYFRDPGVFPMDRTELQKLAAMFAIFDLPDCAGEALCAAGLRAGLDELSALTGAGFSSYAEHIAAFERNDAAFYPPQK